MNYKEKYKQALERAREQYNKRTPLYDIESIFPELAESEDEKIKREIIDYINELADLKNEKIPTKWLDWLEKQAESNPYSGVSFKHNGHIWGMCARDNGVDILLDKQLSKHLDTQGEKKPTDEVKPKFKVGDWVVSNNNEDVWQIGARYTEEGQRIYLYNVNDVIMTTTLDELNNDYHLWTINDVKDGDVLAAKECYVIFKEIDGLNIKCHCTYHYMGFNPSFHINTLQNKKAFHPATQEQRDLLFQKMEEAGYKWNSEKKELKKIEMASKENEDEEIRKGLIKAVSRIFEGYKLFDTDVSREEALAWLEKQKGD